MKTYWWLTDKQYKWCIQAEKEWAERLPGIIKRTNKVIEQWYEEKEYKDRWKLCDW